MNLNSHRPLRRAIFVFTVALCAALTTSAQNDMRLQVGAAGQLHLAPAGSSAQWTSSAPQIAEVFQNGIAVGLHPGQAQISAVAPGAKADFSIAVESVSQSPVDPATLKQFPDSREFKIGNRKCYGSELNGQRAISPEEKQFTRDNRVINPKPLRADKPLDWQLIPDTPVYDGAGVLMGTVPPTLKVGGASLPVSMFNFGASKVINGRIFIYAFSVPIRSSLGATDSGKSTVNTSAWLPLENVVDNKTLLERIGLGLARLPALPLESAGYRVTGGDPKMYMTDAGELSIVHAWKSDGTGAPPVPSHYLRRPSGTFNLVYSVPGFGLGGQGVDSFLVSDGLKFYPARGAKVFHQPTYFPPKSPQPFKRASPTMTFLYGAIKAPGTEPIYGWIAKEALSPTPE